MIQGVTRGQRGKSLLPPPPPACSAPRELAQVEGGQGLPPAAGAEPAALQASPCLAFVSPLHILVPLPR